MRATPLLILAALAACCVHAAAEPTLFEQAAELEGTGKMREAVLAYTKAARSGDGKAAYRLGEIYDRGIGGIKRDYAEAQKWYNAARTLGGRTPLIGDFPERAKSK